MHQRLTNSSAKPASGPECSVPATGCAGTKCTPAGKMRRHVAQHRALDRADIGDDRAGLEMRPDLGRDRAAGADRNADDDEIGALRPPRHWSRPPGRRCRARRRAGAWRPSARSRRSCARRLRARRARDRGADQADADQREAVEQGRFGHAAFPHELGERRDHEPVRLLGADGHAQRVRQLVGADLAQDQAARGEEGVGLLGGAALGLGKMDQHEIGDARRDLQARACRSPR